MKRDQDIHGFSVEDDAKADEIAQKFIDSGRKKRIKSEIESLVDDEFERLQDYATNYITEVAARRAEKFLDKVLAGDENAAMALLGSADNSDRYRTIGYDSGKPWASWSHGSYFETSGIRLRRQIVEAHKDLITSERIKDLESVVDGLSQQIAKMTQQIDEMSRRY